MHLFCHVRREIINFCKKMKKKKNTLRNHYNIYILRIFSLLKGIKLFVLFLISGLNPYTVLYVMTVFMHTNVP